MDDLTIKQTIVKNSELLFLVSELLALENISDNVRISYMEAILDQMKINKIVIDRLNRIKILN